MPFISNLTSHSYFSPLRKFLEIPNKNNFSKKSPLLISDEIHPFLTVKKRELIKIITHEAFKGKLGHNSFSYSNLKVGPQHKIKAPPIAVKVPLQQNRWPIVITGIALGILSAGFYAFFLRNTNEFHADPSSVFKHEDTLPWLQNRSPCTLVDHFEWETPIEQCPLPKKEIEDSLDLENLFPEFLSSNTCQAEFKPIVVPQELCLPMSAKPKQFKKIPTPLEMERLPRELPSLYTCQAKAKPMDDSQGQYFPMCAKQEKSTATRTQISSIACVVIGLASMLGTYGLKHYRSLKERFKNSFSEPLNNNLTSLSEKSAKQLVVANRFLNEEWILLEPKLQEFVLNYHRIFNVTTPLFERWIKTSKTIEVILSPPSEDPGSKSIPLLEWKSPTIQETHKAAPSLPLKSNSQLLLSLEEGKELSIQERQALCREDPSPSLEQFSSDFLDSQGKSLLCYAIEAQDADLVQRLINPSVINQPDKDGILPLQHAVKIACRTDSEISLEIIKILLQNGAVLSDKAFGKQPTNSRTSLGKVTSSLIEQRISILEGLLEIFDEYLKLSEPIDIGSASYQNFIVRMREYNTAATAYNSHLKESQNLMKIIAFDGMDEEHDLYVNSQKGCLRLKINLSKFLEQLKLSVAKQQRLNHIHFLIESQTAVRNLLAYIATTYPKFSNLTLNSITENRELILQAIQDEKFFQLLECSGASLKYFNEVENNLLSLQNISPPVFCSLVRLDLDPLQETMDHQLPLIEMLRFYNAKNESFNHLLRLIQCHIPFDYEWLSQALPVTGSKAFEPLIKLSIKNECHINTNREFNSTLQNFLQQDSLKIKNGLSKIEMDQINISEILSRTNLLIENDIPDSLKFIKNILMEHQKNVRRRLLNFMHKCAQDNSELILNELNQLIDDADNELLNQIANLVEYKNKNGRTFLNEAIDEENSDLIALLIALGASLTVKNGEGWAPCHYFLNFAPETIDLLLTSETINFANDQGFTPLHFVIWSTFEGTIEDPVDIVTQLLSKGADPAIKGKEEPPKEYAKSLLEILKDSFQGKFEQIKTLIPCHGSLQIGTPEQRKITLETLADKIENSDFKDLTALNNAIQVMSELCILLSQNNENHDITTIVASTVNSPHNRTPSTPCHSPQTKRGKFGSPGFWSPTNKKLHRVKRALNFNDDDGK